LPQIAILLIDCALLAGCIGGHGASNLRRKEIVETIWSINDAHAPRMQYDQLARLWPAYSVIAYVFLDTSVIRIIFASKKKDQFST
jgi:hypothetical protein